MSDQALQSVDVLLVTFLELPLHLLDHPLDSPLLVPAQRAGLPPAFPGGLYLTLDDVLLAPLPGHLGLAVPEDHHQVALNLVRPRLLLPGDLHPPGVQPREGRLHLDAQLPVQGEALPLQMGALLQGHRLGGGRGLGKEARSGEVCGVLGGEGGGGGVCCEKLRFEGVAEEVN
jgi:hypothetical protein